MEQIIGAFKLAVQENYFNFEGRANRGEYWYFVLACVIISIILSVVGGLLGSTISMIVSGVFSLGILAPSLGAAARRLHDIGKSGWFLLICFIPLAGLYLIYLLAQPGNQGKNQFGEPSKNLQ